MPLLNIIVYGIFDSLNPCNLSMVVFFAAFLGWLRRRKLPHRQLGWVFIIAFYLSLFAYSLGIGMGVLYSIKFFYYGRVFYTLVGIIFLILSIVHFIDWVFLLKRVNKMMLPLTDQGSLKPIFTPVVVFMAIVSAVILSALSTIWPSNESISFYSNFLAVPGQSAWAMFMLFVYDLMIIVPLVLTMYWIFFTSPSGWGAKNLSKVKIILSSYMLGLGFCLVYIFH